MVPYHFLKGEDNKVSSNKSSYVEKSDVVLEFWRSLQLSASSSLSAVSFLSTKLLVTKLFVEIIHKIYIIILHFYEARMFLE